MAEQHNEATENPMETLQTVPEQDLPEVEIEETEIVSNDVDFSQFSKKDFVEFAEKLLESAKNPQATPVDLKNVESVWKEVRSQFEEIKILEKAEALKAFVSENGSEEGFDFRNDNLTIRFESISVQLRETKQQYFQKIERLKEDNFETKTRLLQELREIVDTEEKGGSKENWGAFKQLQENWKSAGNVNSPHNNSLWQAYNALVDRYFSIRNIQNELKDLDRKKNLDAKTDLVIKIEGLAQEIEAADLPSTVLFKTANDWLAEYKQIGPAPREEQEALWARLKVAFDLIYAKKRSMQAVNQKLQDEILEVKKRLVDQIRPFAAFKSTSINDWNAKTKEVLEIQEQWVAVKGAVDRDKGKETSKDFWKLLKTFFRNKGEFFHALEAERMENLKAKTLLCEQVESLLEAGDVSADQTNQVIEWQKTWRTIGHVPEKQKDTIYHRFKKACDQFFELKRQASSEVDKEYAENLAKKEALIAQIKAKVQESADLSVLSDFKKQFATIGFVPKKDMQRIQSAFIEAINQWVKSASNLSTGDMEKLLLQNEVDVVLKSGKGGNKSLGKQENDLRRKIKALEDDIALWRNNIEFFGPSKGADKLKAEYEKKISASEKELSSLHDKLRLILSAQ